MEAFWICFVTLFVAVDAVGVLPIFISLTNGVDKGGKRSIIYQSVITASVAALVFLLFGPWLLRLIGVTVPDFMIAGGLLLLAISLSDILTGEKKLRKVDVNSLGAVPIGVPLITGPAVLTSSLLLAGLHGILLTAVAILLNILLAGLIFIFSNRITRPLGNTGVKAISKVASLFLAAIAVMLIRRGITDFFVS